MSKLIRTGGDGLDADRIVTWDADVKKNKLRVFLHGKAEPLSVDLDSV